MNEIRKYHFNIKHQILPNVPRYESKYNTPYKIGNLIQITSYINIFKRPRSLSNI